MSERRRWRDHPLVQLTLVRVPRVLRASPRRSSGSSSSPCCSRPGSASRSGAGRRSGSPVALVRAGRRSATRWPRASRRPKGSRSQCSTTRAAARRCARGDVALVVIRRPTRGVRTGTTDAARERAKRAAAWSTQARPAAAGRADPCPCANRSCASRLALHRLRGPRPARHEPDGQRHLGPGLRHRGRAAEDLLKRLVATPMSRAQYLASFVLSRLTFWSLEVALLRRLRRARVRGAAARLAVAPGRHLPPERLAFCVARAAARRAPAHGRGRVRPDEPRHAADVDFLGGLLLLVAFPGRGPAVHPAAARSPRSTMRSAPPCSAVMVPHNCCPELAVIGGVAGGELRPRVAHLPLALGRRER